MRGFQDRPQAPFPAPAEPVSAALWPELARTEACWSALRRGAALPARGDFNPAALSDCLDHLLLLRRCAPGQLRIRIAGRAIAALFGAAPQGMPLTALIAPESRGAVAAQLEELCHSPARLILDLRGTPGWLRAAPRAQLLLLPMTDAEGQPSRLLGCLMTEAAPGSTPQRFTLESCQRRSLTPGDAPTAVSSASRGPAAISAPPHPARKATPHLRLVKG